MKILSCILNGQDNGVFKYACQFRYYGQCLKMTAMTELQSFVTVLYL